MSNQSLREWFTAKEIAGLPELPGTDRSVRRLDLEPNRPRTNGKGLEYHISSLPKAAQRALKISLTKRQQAEEKQTSPLNNARLKGTMAAMAVDGEKKDESVKKNVALNKLSPKEQARVRARSEVLAAWEVYITDFDAIDAATREFVDVFNEGRLGMDGSINTFVPKVSRATLMRWRAAYVEQGPAGLSCNYKSLKQSIIDSQPELLNFVEGMLAKMPHTTVVNMLRAMEGQFDLRDDIRLPGKKTVGSWMASWKVKNKRLFTAVSNPDAFKNKYMVAGGDAAENVVRLNQIWEMDSSPADIMCTDGRFTIISCIDVYSRRAVFKVRQTSDSYGVVLTARQAIIDWGMDGQVYDTNLRTAHAAGQWDRVQRTKKALPYLKYELGPSKEHRKQHVQWNQLLLPADDPFWNTHYPQNGWGCECRVRQISNIEYERIKGKSGLKAPEITRREWTNKRTGEIMDVPEGIDPGWIIIPVKVV